VSTAAAPSFRFEHTFADALPELCASWQPVKVAAANLVVLNEGLAAEIGLDADVLASHDGVDVLVGNAVPADARPVAQAYAGHQFGGWSPRLGDGRALLLGEIVGPDGNRRDLHLKGSGRTPFARGGDGRAVIGPMLREHLIGEAMFALGVPTTRALAVVATGEDVFRETALPGAVLARIASSHLRVGTFQYAASLGDVDVLRRLADHAIARHYPSAAHADDRYAALFAAVVDAQARLIAQWMQLGFVHGVMNTDNTTISGETIDYGPCAFIDTFDPAAVFSSIDHQGRYAFGNQPNIGQWNLARLAESMLSLFSTDTDAAVGTATDVLRTYGDRHVDAWIAGMLAKIGITDEREGDRAIVDELLHIAVEARLDHTRLYRSLADDLRGNLRAVVALAPGGERLDRWKERWRERLGSVDVTAVATAMDRVNPLYIPRNHLVEEALAAATGGDLGPYLRLLDVVMHPYDERPGFERYTEPAPESFAGYRTFCGT
jgi:serine/tyrosine/threonine adenylyltransferase